MNKVILHGKLGKDPEVKYTANGKAVATASMATSKTYNDTAGVRQTKTTWHNLKVWGKRAEAFAQYLAKGRQVYIDGRLQTRQYEKDGQTHYATEIVANEVQFLGDRQGDRPPAANPDDYGPIGQANDDDIPF
jgi:single-strand DNA-binding protein